MRTTLSAVTKVDRISGGYNSIRPVFAGKDLGVDYAAHEIFSDQHQIVTNLHPQKKDEIHREWDTTHSRLNFWRW